MILKKEKEKEKERERESKCGMCEEKMKECENGVRRRKGKK